MLFSSIPFLYYFFPAVHSGIDYIKNKAEMEKDCATKSTCFLCFEYTYKLFYVVRDCIKIEND